MRGGGGALSHTDSQFLYTGTQLQIEQLWRGLKHEG